ncbi:MAG TPA: XRE family transcriptional regulator [Gammaproteobacteria bacterium]|nr:XRE family transcriptional regulator [Gammaproteobacteria bacterium]
MQGLSQEELAERSCLHRTYIGAVERAERNITLKVLEKIAKGLDIEPGTLISKDFIFP